MEKAAFKATSRDCVTPKKKHVDRLVQMTWLRDTFTMPELFMVLEGRFSEPSWVITFKTLIVIHILMLEGDPHQVLGFLTSNNNVLDLHRFRDQNGTRSFDQSKNIRLYANYLICKVSGYREFKVDFVRDQYPSRTQINGEGKVDIPKLFQEVGQVQKQIYVLLKAKFFIDTVDNEVTFTAFRLLIRDLLKLFQAMNMGVIKMLKGYFTMPQEDMKRALELYKRFIKITERVTDYLDNARQLQSAFGMTIPSLRHAPVSLAVSLEEYLNSPEAQLPPEERPTAPAKKSTRLTKNQSMPIPSATLTRKKSAGELTRKPLPVCPASPTKPASYSSQTMGRASTQPKAMGPAPTAKEQAQDLIDFFSSIENEVVVQPVAAPANPNAPTGGTHILAGQSALDFPTPSFQGFSTSVASAGGVTANPFMVSTPLPSVIAMAGLAPQQPQLALPAVAPTSNPFHQRQTMYVSTPATGSHGSSFIPDSSASMALVPVGAAQSSIPSSTPFISAQSNQLARPSHNPFTQRQSMFATSNPFASFQATASHAQPPPPTGGTPMAPLDPFSNLFGDAETGSVISNPPGSTGLANTIMAPMTSSTKTTTTFSNFSASTHQALPLLPQQSVTANTQPFQSAALPPPSSWASSGPTNSVANPVGSTAAVAHDATQPLFDAAFDTQTPGSAPNGGAPQSLAQNPFPGGQQASRAPSNPFSFATFQ